MSEIPSFGAWLKRRRKALDLTQSALARLVGCSVVSIRKIEADEQRPSHQIAERLAAQLQVAPEDAMTAFHHPFAYREPAAAKSAALRAPVV